MALFLGGGERTRPLARPVAGPGTRDIVLRAPTSRRPTVGVGPSLADERAFVHKRIFGGIKGFLSGGPVGAAAGFVSGGGKAPTVSRPSVFRRPLVPTRAAAMCPPGFFETPAGGCQPVAAPALVERVPGIRGAIERFIPGGATGFQVDGQEFGEAQMGRFGAGLEPAIRSTSTRVCPRGAVLAVDGLCYNRRDIRNSERAWPRGRRPLLTGGEMRCINVASSAAKKLQRKQKQLEQLGLLKRPSRSRRALPAGHVAQIKHG